MKTVLVVDDEPSVAEIIVLALEGAGFRVVSASNGQEALDRLAEAAPDIIVTDYMMPRLDGAGLIKRIRAMPQYDGVPIVLMSAVAVPLAGDDDDRPSEYLRKPFRLSEVVAVIEGLLLDE